MADEFDSSLAAEKHEAIISEVQRIRDSLTNDVINYYYHNPTTADEERAKREGMRKYLKIAYERIYELMNGKLY